MICIDPSEYRGHEREEFFVILLKYLYDNAINCSIVMTCCQYSDADLMRLYNSCIRILPVFKKRIDLFNRNSLTCLLESAFCGAGITCAPSAIQLIARFLEAPELRDYRNLQLINRIPFEISRQSVVEKMQTAEDSFDRHITQTVSLQDVENYFRRSDSAICMMAGHALASHKIQEKEYE